MYIAKDILCDAQRETHRRICYGVAPKTFRELVHVVLESVEIGDIPVQRWNRRYHFTGDYNGC